MFAYAIYILGVPIGTNVSLYTRMCDPRFFIVGSTDAFTGLKLLHLPLHATDSYKWAQGDELSARQWLQCTANKWWS